MLIKPVLDKYVGELPELKAKLSIVVVKKKKKKGWVEGELKILDIF